MLVNQEVPEFKPITITLETKEEADAFAEMVNDMKTLPAKKLKNELSNWFSEKAKV